MGAGESSLSAGCHSRFLVACERLLVRVGCWSTVELSSEPRLSMVAHLHSLTISPHYTLSPFVHHNSICFGLLG